MRGQDRSVGGRLKIVAAMKVLKSKSLFSLREKMLDGIFLAKFKKNFKTMEKAKCQTLLK